MIPASVKRNGQLKEIYKPAIYMDTNFLRHYFNCEGAEFYYDEKGNNIKPPWEEGEPGLPESSMEKRTRYIQDLMIKNEYMKEFGQIRHYTTYNITNASLILTPISLLEMYKVHAEVTFKEVCAESLGAKRIQRMGDKDVGKYLSKIYGEYKRDKGNEIVRSLIDECVFNMSFARCHGLEGLFYIADQQLRVTETDVGRFLSLLSVLQIDTTDIIHLHTAKLLGCDYFATYDSVIIANKAIIKESAGIDVLCNAKELIDVLKKNKKTIAPNKRLKPTAAAGKA